MKLIVGTNSTWSLRALLCTYLAEQNVEVLSISLDKDDYKGEILSFSNAGKVPILIDQELVIHDSLAITEYLNEVSAGALWPELKEDRALARSLCAEMHSGFVNLRTQCPFTLFRGQQLSHSDDELRQELKRIEAIFSAARGPYYFEKATAVDAFFAILAYRLFVYGIELTGKSSQYMQALLEWPLLDVAVNEANDW